MTRKIFLLVLIVAVLALPRSAHAAKDYTAREYNVDIEVLPGGALLVSETVIFSFSGGPFTFVFRTLETDYVDAFEDFQAWMDGQALPPGGGPGQVEISPGKPIRVTWHFAPLSDSTHTFTLRYRAVGVVRQSAGADLLEWNALPTEHAYPIQSAKVTVHYPPEAGLVADPAVVRGQAAVEKVTGEVVFLARDVQPDQPLHISLAFAPGSLLAAPPQWQARQAQTAAILRQLMPWNLVSGLAILFLGITGFIFWRAQSGRDRQPLPPSPGTLPSPPSDLAPGIAAALVTRDDVSWAHALGTLFGLSRRGWLQINELPGGPWGRRKFEIEFTGDASKLEARAAALAPHERGLLEMLFLTPKGRREKLSLSELSSVAARRMKTFAEPLKQELRMNGLSSLERQATRTRITYTAVVVLLLGLVGAPIALLFANVARGGEAWNVFRWTLLLFSASVALFLVGLFGVVLGSGFSPLTERGEQEGERWRAFFRYLKDVVRGREPPVRPDLFDVYLPYAAAFGMAEHWAAFFKKQGLSQPPAWFRPLTQEGSAAEMAAFLAVISASSSAGAGGAAGAGAGGAAGAGASGAG